MWPENGPVARASAYSAFVLAQFSTPEFNSRLNLDPESLSLLAGLAVVLVDLDDEHRVHSPGLTPCIVVGRRGNVRDPSPDRHDGCDVIVDDDRQLDEILTTIERSPQAAVAAALLLRGVEHRSVEESLIAESTTYSLLQSGAEFAQWKSDRIVKDHRPTTSSVVIAERVDRSMTITLNQPDRRNAYSSAMRQSLAEALQVVLADDGIEKLILRGAGNNFSSGGDLDEFGSFSNPLNAHLSRLTSNVAMMLETIRQRLGKNLRCEMHGENFGAGIELPAFAGHAVATSTTKFCLPEVALGLVPGAGGTASLPRRIGRQRTAWLALTGRAIDAEMALKWGLIDEISD